MRVATRVPTSCIRRSSAWHRDRMTSACMRRLKPDELRAICDPASLPFTSTEDLPALEGMIGQERALSATTFGIGVRYEGYNLFVLGPPATGKTTTMRRLLTKAAHDRPVPSDWCYVHSFGDSYRPTAIEVPAG